MYDLIAIVPVIVGVTEVFKMVGMPSRFSPLFALALGMAIVYFVGETSVADRLFTGAIAGLAASGLYSGVKKQLTE